MRTFQNWGDLVDVPFADGVADAEASGVVGGAPADVAVGFGIGAHGADFINGEAFAAASDADLLVKDGAGALAVDEVAEEEDEGGADDEAD